MLEEIGRPEDVASAVDRAKDKNSGFRLLGFGHRVYKNYDPRAAIIREMTHKVLAELGVNDPLLEVALRLEDAALKDAYFVSRSSAEHSSELQSLMRNSFSVFCFKKNNTHT